MEEIPGHRPRSRARAAGGDDPVGTASRPRHRLRSRRSLRPPRPHRVRRVVQLFQLAVIVLSTRSPSTCSSETTGRHRADIAELIVVRRASHTVRADRTGNWVTHLARMDDWRSGTAWTTLEQPGVPFSGGTLPMHIRLLSVPSGHVYVDHLDDPNDAATDDVVIRLPDPALPGRAAGAPWWPPVASRPTGSSTIWRVRRVPRALRLRRPAARAAWGSHGGAAPRARRWSTRSTTCATRTTGPRLHDDHLDVLVPAADALVTLTPGPPPKSSAWGRARPSCRTRTSSRSRPCPDRVRP